MILTWTTRQLCQRLYGFLCMFVSDSKIRGATSQELAAADVERSAHRETIESLELSETSVNITIKYMYSITYTVLRYFSHKLCRKLVSTEF